MLKTRKKGSNPLSIRGKLIVGFIVNLLVISLIIISIWNPTSDVAHVEAAIVHDEEVDPINFPSIEYSSAEIALDEANEQLSEMELGNIYTIDDEDEYFYGRLIGSYEMGDVLNWDLGDDFTEVSLEAYTGEILYYHHYGYSEGDLTESQARVLAGFIVLQFDTIPNDSEEPIVYEDTTFTWTETDSDTMMEDIDEVWNYWVADFNRSKDSIQTDDKITVVMNPNGDLNEYYKDWNMDLNEFSTYYLVSIGEAEDAALDYLGEGTVLAINKRIVRPNYHWEVPESPLDIDENATIAFGLDPKIVWSVFIKDDNDGACLIHVDGINEKIIGGTYIPHYYETE